MSTIFEHILDDRICGSCKSFSTLLEGGKHFLECLVFPDIPADILMFLRREWIFHGEDGEEHLLASLKVVVLHDIDHAVPDHIGDIHADTLSHERMTATFVNHLTLLIHDVIVFEEALTDSEVVLLHLLLSALDGLVDHRMFNHLTLLESESVHDVGDTVGSEETHELVLQRHIEDGRAWVTLTSCTSTKLAVHTAALMPLRTDDGQTSRRLHFGRELDVGTTTSHVGGDGDDRLLSSLCHDIRLLLVEFCIEHIMLYLPHGEHLGEHLGDLDGSGTDENRPSLIDHILYFLNDRLVLLTVSAVNAVVHVDTCNRLVCWDFHHIEFIDIPELASLRDGCTGHTCQFVVHAEVVLEGDGGESLRSRLHLHAFLGLDRLMESVAPAPSLHDTSGLLIYDFHLTIHDDIVVVLDEHGVCLEELLHGVHPLRLDGIVLEELVLLRQPFLFLKILIVEFRKLSGDVRKHEEIIVLDDLRHELVTLVGHLHRLEFLFHYEEERIGSLRHPSVVVLHIDSLSLEESTLDTVLREELDERVVLRHTLVGTEEGKESRLHLFRVVGIDLLLRRGEIIVGELFLSLHQFLHDRAVFLEHLYISLRHWSGNDERCPSIVDEHRVNLIDNGIVVCPLHEFLRIHGHVVAQVVETELVVRTERDVGLICFPTRVGVWLMLVDAIDRQSVEHIERSHPLRVTLGEVVVDRNDMHTVACERIEEHRQRCHERLTLTCCHLGDFSLMEHGTTDELHVVVDHVPHRLVASSFPLVVPDGLVAVDIHKIVGLRQFSVEIGGSDLNLLVLGESSCRFLYDGKDHRQVFIKSLLKDVENFFFQLVNLIKNWLSFLDIRLLDLRIEFCDLIPLGLHHFLELRLDLVSSRTQFIVGELLNLRINGIHLIDNRSERFHVASRLIAEQFTDKTIKSHGSI